MTDGTQTSFCECREDWTDGAALCQECGKPRRSDDPVDDQRYDNAHNWRSGPTPSERVS